MTKAIKIALLAILQSSMIAPLFGQGPSPAPAVFKDSSLGISQHWGFHYTPPANMLDFTAVEGESIHQSPMSLGTKLHLLLSLRSGANDTAVDWHSVKIVTYPSGKFGNLSDSTASREAFTRWVAEAGKETGQRSKLRIGDFHFFVSTFEVDNGQLRKYTRVYTADWDGQMVSLAFSANSLAVLNNVVASMKTFGPVDYK